MDNYLALNGLISVIVMLIILVLISVIQFIIMVYCKKIMSKIDSIPNHKKQNKDEFGKFKIIDESDGE